MDSPQKGTQKEDSSHMVIAGIIGNAIIIIIVLLVGLGALLGWLFKGD